MTIKVTCPICGGEVLLAGEESTSTGKNVHCYLCEPCDHTFYVDEHGKTIQGK